MTKGVISRPPEMGTYMEQEPRVRELLAMLTYRRPGGSKTESKFINRFIRPLGVTEDSYGNLWKTVGEGSPILFSSHTDTVHRHSGKGRVVFGDGIATQEGSNCLGADDTTGVWLMLNMIRAGVPGTYLFHRDEESGGGGSRYVSKNAPQKMLGFKYAIAFDRKDYSDIITHQSCGKCASDAFARSLATILEPAGQYKASDEGTFTDTANYAGIIPECTNLSVGYFDQHTKAEAQDVFFAVTLLDTLVAADWSQLVCEREPGDYGDVWDDWEGWKNHVGYYSGPGHYSSSTVTSYTPGPPATMGEYVRRYPTTVADFLSDMGFTIEDLEDYEWKERIPRLDRERNKVVDLTDKGHGPDADEPLDPNEGEELPDEPDGQSVLDMIDGAA